MNPRGVALVFVPVFGSITRAPRSSVSELPSLQDDSPLHPGRRPLLGVADQVRIVEIQKGEESFQGMSEPMLVTTLRQGTVWGFPMRVGAQGLQERKTRAQGHHGQ